MNTHEIAAAWSVHKLRAQRGEITTAALVTVGRELIAHTSPADLKAQRFLDLVVKPDVEALTALVRQATSAKQVAARTTKQRTPLPSSSSPSSSPETIPS